MSILQTDCRSGLYEDYKKRLELYGQRKYQKYRWSYDFFNLGEKIDNTVRKLIRKFPQNNTENYFSLSNDEIKKIAEQ
jgi:hypothetical protein